MARICVLLVVGLVLGCSSRTVSSGRARPANAERGPDAAAGQGDPDDTCLSSAEEKRGPGQACVCGSDCTTEICEEGVCCTGAACGAKRALGAACTQSSQCTSGFCADGVCCNVACTGACLSCNQPETLGECLPVAAGLEDPHQICRRDAPETCGQMGVCNGQGGCARYPADTVCQLGSCTEDGQFLPPGICDGEGVCISGLPISCAPSRCEGGECNRTCTSDAQCAAGKNCVNGTCGKFGPGQSCTQKEDCESGFCVDGVCCESACEGVCQTCANPKSRGKCVPAVAGAVDPACPVTAPSTCGTTGKCSGNGACAQYDDDTICRAARCDAGENVAIMAARCSGGACPAPQRRNCAPYKGCDGNACAASCGSDAQCVGGNVCSAGSCGRSGNGARCTSDSQCDSNHCSQGFCCDSACNGVCKSCALPGQQGTCANVPAGGADPGGDCGLQGCSNGCNGAGACRQDREGTACGGAPSCNGAVRTTYQCNANGACEPRTQTCGGATPLCTRDGCAAPEGKGPGESCVKAADCRDGLSCVASGGRNVCCTAACGSSCQQCAANGVGCVNKPDGSSCGGGSTCRDGVCCPAGTTRCGNACVRTDSDAGNCGACGKACGKGQTCSNGQCGCVPRTCQSSGWECGTGGDGCGGTLTCPACKAGTTCNPATHRCEGAACVPKTCATEGWQCGMLSTGCGTTVPCGPCKGGTVCNQSTHKCEMPAPPPPPPPPPPCQRKTCKSVGWECGSLDDGCGGTASCSCPGQQKCNQATHKCEMPAPPPPPPPPPPCQRKTCKSVGWECGSLDDGCGGTASCSCPGQQKCNQATHQCERPMPPPPPPPPPCQRKTCKSVGWECGSLDDGCGGTASCSCPGQQRCNQATHQCEKPAPTPMPMPMPDPPKCTPRTCQSAGWECGSGGDGCKGMLACGNCAMGERCMAHKCVPGVRPPRPTTE